MLDGLGLLKMTVARMVASSNNGIKHEVRFRKSFYFNQQLQEMKKMEKLGVDEGVDPNLEKHAAQGCPECGSPVERHGRILVCPKCGTAPFEKKTEK